MNTVSNVTGTDAYHIENILENAFVFLVFHPKTCYYVLYISKQSID